MMTSARNRPPTTFLLLASDRPVSCCHCYYGVTEIAKNQVTNITVRKQTNKMASQRRFFQQFITNLNNRPRTKLALQLSASAAVASMPIMYWSHTARKERANREHEVATRIRCVNCLWYQ